MKTPVNKRLLAVWLVLVAITVMYLWIDNTADDHVVRLASTAVTVAAIGLALIKAWLILREFMDVRHAPARLRRLTDAMVVAVGAALLIAYFAGRAAA